MNSRSKERLIYALSTGWGFIGLKFNESKTSRHTLWVNSPHISGGWVANKVDASISEDDFLDALLDEAGVPKLKNLEGSSDGETK